MGDALSLCAQSIALGNGSITKDTVLHMLGSAGDGFVTQVLDLLTPNSQTKLENVLSSIKSISPNYKALLDDLVVAFHDLAL